MRRKIGSMIPLLLAALLLTGCGGSSTANSTPATSAVQNDAQTTLESADLFAMDTYMNLKVYSIDGHAPVKEAADRIEALEQTFSVTKPESDIGRVNASGTAEVSDDTTAVIAKAIEIGDESSGALDISVYPVLRAWGFTTDEMHVPDADALAELLKQVDYTQIALDGNTVTLPEGMEIDLGALAKGYTSDAVMEIFRAHGAQSGIISLGGNVQALGRKPDGSLWKVGIVNPFSVSENLCVLEIENQAVITSGNYERYFTDEDGNVYWHIIDKADGYPADNGLVSVTIVGDSGLECDARSTALFVEGEEKAVAHWRNTGGFEMVLVTDDGRILLTEGLADVFENTSGLPAEVIHHE